MGFHREAQRPLPRPLPRPAGAPAVRDVHPEGRRRAVPARDAGRHRAGPLDRPGRRRPGAGHVGRGVPLARPTAVTVDAGDLRPRPQPVRAAAVRLLPHRPAAGRRDRELAQRRDRCRHRAVVGASPLPNASAGAPGRGREGEAPRQPVRPGPAAPCADAGDGVPLVGGGGRPGRGDQRALPGPDLPGGRQRHAVVGACRPAPGQGRPQPRQGGCHRAADSARVGGVGPYGAQDRCWGAVDDDLTGDGGDPRRACRSVHRAGHRLTRVPEQGRQPADLVELPAALLQAGPRRCRSGLPIPRPQAHKRGVGHRRGRPPEGDPGAHGPLLDQRDARPLRPPLPGAGRGDRGGLRRADRGGAAAATRPGEAGSWLSHPLRNLPTWLCASSFTGATTSSRSSSNSWRAASTTSSASRSKEAREADSAHPLGSGPRVSRQNAERRDRSRRS